MNNIFYKLLIILKNVHQISPRSHFATSPKYKNLSDIASGARWGPHNGGDLRRATHSLFTPRLALIRPFGAISN